MLEKSMIVLCCIFMFFISESLSAQPFNAVLGQRCSFDTDCPIQNSYCHEDSCECRNTFVQSHDGTMCLNIVTVPGDNCLEDVQCRLTGGASSCRASECLLCKSPSYIGYSTCNDTNGCAYHEYDNRCWKTRDVGQMCSSSEECWRLPGLNTTRVCDKVCVCARNLLYSTKPTPDEDRCQPYNDSGTNSKFTGSGWRLLMATLGSVIVATKIVT